MAGVGSHAAGSSSGSYGNKSGSGSSAVQYRQHQYDSSGDYASPNTSTARLQASNGPSMRAMVMQQQQQQQQQSQLAYATQHRHAQASDDYDNNVQYASYNAGHPDRIGTPTGYSAATPRADRDNRDPRDILEGDNSFDFLLSPGLAPVGPISTSSSFGNLPPPLAPSPSQAPPPLPNSTNGLFSPSTTPSRPMFNRSQTAMPAPSTSGRAFQAPAAYAGQPQGSIHSSDHAVSSGLNSSLGPASNGNISAGQPSSSHQNGRDFTPPPAINAKALLEIVLNLRADQPVSTQASSTSSSSANMSRSQSANTAVRLQQASQLPAHMRNISTGSNRSDEDTGMSSSQVSNNLMAPSHPGMARTASSRNINDTSASNLRTIDLTHHRIADVPSEVIDALEGTVGRYGVLSILRQQHDQLTCSSDSHSVTIISLHCLLPLQSSATRSDTSIFASIC